LETQLDVVDSMEMAWRLDSEGAVGLSEIKKALELGSETRTVLELVKRQLGTELVVALGKVLD
jgi:hypothetical protein